MSENNTHKILIVDDSPQDIKMVMESLKENYTVIAATTGTKAIEICGSDNKPDLVLMDVNMPEMDGYEACKAILEGHDISVIFFSANDSTEEILKGFEAGGIDYIVKPYLPDVLISKIQLALEQESKKQALAQQSDFASKTAMDALHAASDIGQVLDFARKSLDFEDAESLAEGMVKTVNSFGLACSAQLHTANGIVETSERGEISNLESELLTRILQQEGRILDQGSRMFCTYDHVALLLQNMPVDDPDKCGRIRDNLAILVECANSKLLNLDKVAALKASKAQEVELALKGLTHSLNGVREHIDRQKSHKLDSMKIMDEMIQNVEDSFLQLGLTEGQEQGLLDILSQGTDKALKHFESGADMDEQFDSIIKELNTINSLNR